MKSEALHFEVIREKKAILAELVHSQKTGRRLAICLQGDDKLIVKIAVVMSIHPEGDHTTLKLRADPADATSECQVSLGTIESLYPMHS